MNSLKDLHKLVHSMTMNEKRYFRLFASKMQKESAPHYLQLFEVLNKSDQFDAKDLNKRLEKQSYFPRISYTQNYLHNHIMDVLRQFRKDKYSSNKVLRLIEEVEILFDNGLIRKAHSTLKRARKELDKNMDERLLPIILDWEDTSIRGSWSKKIKEEDKQKLYEDQKESVRSLEYRRKVDKWRSQIVNISNTGLDLRDKELRTKIQEYLNLLEKEEPAAFISKNTQMAAFTGLVIGHFTLGQFKQAIIYLEKQRQIIKEDKALAMNLFVEVMTNYAIIVSQAEEEELFHEILAEIDIYLQTEKGVSAGGKKYLEDSIPALKLLYFIFTRKWQEAHQAAVQFEEILTERGVMSDLQDYVSIAMPIPLAYFHSGDYLGALRMNNELLNNLGVRSGIDLEAYLRMLEVMIHYELGSIQLLPSKLRSLHRFLKTKGRLYGVEKIFLKLFKSVSSHSSSSNKKAAFVKAKDHLEKLVEEDCMEHRTQQQILLLDYLKRRCLL